MYQEFTKKALRCNGGRDHSNAASPKSQMSRGNFLRSVCFALLVASITFSGCKKDDDNGKVSKILIGTWRSTATSTGNYTEYTFRANKTYVEIFSGMPSLNNTGTYDFSELSHGAYRITLTSESGTTRGHNCSFPDAKTMYLNGTMYLKR